ncbi:sensor histidine kinase [Candidatus Solirubrobacter pratensis]|uniref:sensor histidine kinase n=1 Tax=Candidatus Solirubrobacter pratensis TaxID=1298857 RepID=UPI00041ADE03|nr:HAMP domain-containing sensor histidine kinase [Candidatus Solirubrobacter pratensis]
MPLRRRLTVAAAVAVAVAVALACFVAYLAVRGELISQVDEALTAQVSVPPRPGGRRFPALSARNGGPTPYIQRVAADGSIGTFGSEDTELPVDSRTLAVAAGTGGSFFTDMDVNGTHVRVLTAPDPYFESTAVQVGRSLDSTDGVLSRLRVILLLVCLGGVALAVALGRLVSRNVVAPIVAVTEAARHIAATEDLGRRIAVTSQDEVGELAQHFNAMLDTLEGSIASQRQLVADASHELRTPITSLRTNIEVLAESDGLAREERERLLEDVEEQVAELGALVTDLIELGRGDEPRRETEDVRLDELVEEAVARARRHAPRVRFESQLEPAVVEGTRERLARAVNNLLDNAATHSQPGGLVEVYAGAEGLRVRDHGDGIDEADLPYLFDRFYRGASARRRPGSGLGLAIVRQVAEQHGGSVRAANAPGGGAEFTVTLPVVAPAGLWAAG